VRVRVGNYSSGRSVYPLEDIAMPRPLRDWRLIAGLLVVFLPVALAVKYYFGNQARNMRAAERHAEAIRTDLESLAGSDPGFGRIRVAEFTKHDGSMIVSGVVASEEHRDKLRRFILSTNPPVSVEWDVHTKAEWAELRAEH